MEVRGRVRYLRPQVQAQWEVTMMEPTYEASGDKSWRGPEVLAKA